MTEPDIVASGLSCSLVDQGEALRIEIYKLVTDKGWTLEVVASDGTSTVWEDPFSSAEAALDEASATISREGGRSFQDRSNVVPFRRP